MRKYNFLLIMTIALAAGTLLLTGCEKAKNDDTKLNTPTPTEAMQAVVTDTPVPTEDVGATATDTPVPTDTPTPTESVTIPGEGTVAGDDTSPFNGQVKTEDDTVVTDVKSRIVKNFDFSDGSDKNNVFVISSLEELNAYTAGNAANYDLGTAYSGESFEEAVKAYDEAFFKDHDLIVVRITASSGSTTYTVSGVRFSTDSFTGKRTIQPVIEAETPEIFTDDMAYYHVLIEISKEYGASECGTLSPVSGLEFDNESEAIGTEKH